MRRSSTSTQLASISLTDAIMKLDLTLELNAKDAIKKMYKKVVQNVQRMA